MKKVTNGTFTGAASYLDDAYIEEAAESRMNAETKNEKNKARILPRRARRWLIPAVAALLIAAILVPTLIVMNRTPEPTASAQNGAEGQAPEDEPQNDPAALPTEQTEPTEPTAEDPATETKEETAARPVWNPYKTAYQAPFLSIVPFWADTGACQAIIKITGVKNERKTWWFGRGTPNEAQMKFTKITYDMIYCIKYDADTVGLASKLDSLLETNGNTLYFPDSVLETASVGDTYLCSLESRDHALFAGIYAANKAEYVISKPACVPFVDGKLNEIWILGNYSDNLKYIQTIIDRGFDVVNKELTERKPDMIQAGISIEEIIYIVDWFNDVRAVATVTPSPGKADSWDITI